MQARQLLKERGRLMLDYLYDGTFEGFLTCVYHHYYTDKASGIFPAEEYQRNLMNTCFEVETDQEKAGRVYAAIGEKISKYDLRRVYKAFRSDVDEKEMKILNYLVLGFRVGSRVSRMHANDAVLPVQKAESLVARDIDKYLGLVRFTETENGIMYGPLEPDTDVIEFIAEHFSDRFRNEPFILHDLRREKAVIAHCGRWYISSFTEKDVPSAGKEDADFQKLWRAYFDHIAIKERINPKLQKSIMPKKYWTHLTEMQPEQE